MRADRKEPKPTGVVGAQLALSDLREAMATIRSPHPAYRPDTGPTAADNCALILQQMEWNLKQIGCYLDEVR